MSELNKEQNRHKKRETSQGVSHHSNRLLALVELERHLFLIVRYFDPFYEEISRFPKDSSPLGNRPEAQWDLVKSEFVHLRNFPWTSPVDGWIEELIQLGDRIEQDLVNFNIGVLNQHCTDFRKALDRRIDNGRNLMKEEIEDLSERAMMKEIPDRPRLSRRLVIAISIDLLIIVVLVINQIEQNRLIQEQNMAIQVQVAAAATARQTAEAKLDVRTVVAAFEAAAEADTALNLDLDGEIEDVRRQAAATFFVQEGEHLLAGEDNYEGAEAWFKAALALKPPADTPVYVYVPAGEFNMGSRDKDEWASSNEKPQHSVYLDAYWIMRTEVTNAQYARCVQAGPCTQPNNRHWNSSQFARKPVTHVDWEQARTYAEWVGGRLPTEAEWEKACRGGRQIPADPLVGWGELQPNQLPQRVYPWGNDNPTPWRLNYGGTGRETWADVGGYPAGASPYGAYDLAGNVWEWVEDWYAEDYYAESPDRNPQGPEGGGSRVVRGGAFLSFDNVVRCAARLWYGPRVREVYFGFRVVVASPSAPEQ